MPFFIAFFSHCPPYVSNAKSAKRMLAREIMRYVLSSGNISLLYLKYSLYRYILAHAAKTPPFQGFAGEATVQVNTKENTE